MKVFPTLRKYANYIVLGLFGLNLLLLLVSILGAFQPDVLTPPVISSPVPGVTTIRIPEPFITEKRVIVYFPVEDRASIRALLDENKQLKLKVQELNVARAEWESKGGGQISWTTGFDSSLTETPAFKFKDWRLTFEGVGNRATYTLSQKFTIINTTSRDKHNVTTNLFRLYEIGPDNERLPIPVTETKTVVTTPPNEGWYVKPTMQGGWSAVITIPTVPTAAATTYTAGVIAVPWLKHGTTRAVEDTRWSFFTPTVTFTKTERTIGVMPVSFNLGTLPRQPFSDIWISPYVGFSNSPNLSRTGFVFTVTF